MTESQVSTERLELLPLAWEAIDALLAGDAERVQALTGATFRQASPPPYMAEPLPLVRDRLRERPDEALWWNWLILRKQSREAMGQVAFGGRAGPDGSVLIGYA